LAFWITPDKFDLIFRKYLQIRIRSGKDMQPLYGKHLYQKAVLLNTYAPKDNVYSRYDRSLQSLQGRPLYR